MPSSRLGLAPLRALATSFACAACVACFACALPVACSSSESSAVVTATAADAEAPPAAEAGVTGPGPDAALDAQSPTLGTGGSGGLACTRHDDLGGGRTSCVAKIGSVEVKLVGPRTAVAGNAGPLRLGLYLHGDGAGAHKSNSVLKAMVPWTDAAHGIGVSILAPNGCAWWQTPAHDCTSMQADPDVAAENAAALVIALDVIMKAYDVRTDGIRYYGSSGGSIFLTGEWLPLQGGRYPGVFALMCGGEVPSLAYAWDSKDVALRAKDPLWFTYGDQDFLLTDITAAEAAFKGKGFALTEKVIPGKGHCEFDAHAEAIGIWTANP